MKILVVEDDPKTAGAIRAGLVAESYAATVAQTGDKALSLLDSETFDLVILDWMLPGANGIDILRSLRQRGAKPPVLLLTARDTVEDRVLGLDSGADDYLVKPFAFAELLARLRALLRRAGNAEMSRNRFGDLTIDVRSRSVNRAGREIALTPREFDLLAYLVRYAGQVVTRQMLAREVWREPNRCTPLDNVIDVHIARLRKKIDEGRETNLIGTVRGVGFILHAEPGPTQ
jgi:two-component system copper resistance phosphate regulon response regulator CusR